MTPQQPMKGAVAHMPDERTYIRVHDGIEDHPKTGPLSDKAFRLLVTTWGWCSRHRTDGRVPLGVWKQRGTPKARAELVTANLAELYADHVQMHDYLEHQRSAEQIAEKVDAKRRAGASGNHIRWHVKENKFDPSCDLCVANGSHVRSQVRGTENTDLGNGSNLRNANDHLDNAKTTQGSEGRFESPDRHGNDGLPAETPRGHLENVSHLRSQNGSQRDRETSPETETETETEVPIETLGRGVPVGNARATKRPPKRCPKHTHDPDPPPCRACGDARLAAEAFDANQVRAARAARATEARERADLRARQIANCQLCDTGGYVGQQLCDHDPRAAERAARGREAVRAALNGKQRAAS